MSTPEATTGVPITSPAMFSGPGAPPAITNPTPPTKKEGFLKEFVLGIFYLIFTGYAIYYGWIYGQQNGRQYLLYVQSWAPWLRSWFIRPAPVRVI
jgi:hypothetical protein